MILKRNSRNSTEDCSTELWNHSFEKYTICCKKILIKLALKWKKSLVSLMLYLIINYFLHWNQLKSFVHESIPLWALLQRIVCTRQSKNYKFNVLVALIFNIKKIFLFFFKESPENIFTNRGNVQIITEYIRHSSFPLPW